MYPLGVTGPQRVNVLNIQALFPVKKTKTNSVDPDQTACSVDILAGSSLLVFCQDNLNSNPDIDSLHFI